MSEITIDPEITGDAMDETSGENGAGNGGNGSAARLEAPPARGAQGEELDQFLAQFGAGYQAQLHRAAPLWAAGYLSTIPLEGGLTLADIRESWGGRKFRIKILDAGGRYVTQINTMIADVPRDNGRPINQLDHVERDTAAKPAAAQRSEVAELSAVVREVMQRQQDLLERVLLAPPEAAPPAALALSPLDSIQQAAEMIAAVKGLGGLVDPVAPGGENDFSMKMIEKLIERWDARQQQPAQPAPQPAPPARGPRPKVIFRPMPGQAPGPAPDQAPASRPAAPPADPGAAPPGPLAIAPNPATSLETETLADSSSELDADDLSSGLLALPVDEAADVIRSVFDSLSPADQKRAIDVMLGNVEKPT